MLNSMRFTIPHRASRDAVDAERTDEDRLNHREGIKQPGRQLTTLRVKSHGTAN